MLRPARDSAESSPSVASIDRKGAGRLRATPPADEQKPSSSSIERGKTQDSRQSPWAVSVPAQGPQAIPEGDVRKLRFLYADHAMYIDQNPVSCGNLFGAAEHPDMILGREVGYAAHAQCFGSPVPDNVEIALDVLQDLGAHYRIVLPSIAAGLRCIAYKKGRRPAGARPCRLHCHSAEIESAVA